MSVLLSYPHSENCCRSFHWSLILLSRKVILHAFCESWGAFHHAKDFGNFGRKSEFKWKGPFRFLLTGIFWITSGGGPHILVGIFRPKFAVPFLINRFFALIGPLHDRVIWYEITYTGRSPLYWWVNCTVGLPKQCACLCFGIPTTQHFHQYIVYCTMWPGRAKGLLGNSVEELKMTRANSIGWPSLLGKCLFIFLRYFHWSQTGLTHAIVSTETSSNILIKAKLISDLVLRVFHLTALWCERRETLVRSGHVSPRIWEMTMKLLKGGAIWKRP